jgi:hypothetical protein
MGDISSFEEAWQRKAMQASVAAVRGLIGPGHAIPDGTPIGRLSDIEFGWMIAAVIFAWIGTRAEQAATEGLKHIEEAMRSAPPQNGHDAWDKGAVAAILPMLASGAGVDWDKSLREWSKDEMCSFLLFAVSLVRAAMDAREQAR